MVVGVDPTEAGAQAMHYAVAFARASYAELHAVRAWTYPQAWHNRAANRDRREAACLDAQRCLAEALRGLPTDIEIFPVLREGPTRRVLLSYASRDDDRLVLGDGTGHWWTHGSGATTRYCVAKARQPVIVVPARPAAVDCRDLS